MLNTMGKNEYHLCIIFIFEFALFVHIWNQSRISIVAVCCLLSFCCMFLCLLWSISIPLSPVDSYGVSNIISKGRQSGGSSLGGSPDNHWEMLGDSGSVVLAVLVFPIVLRALNHCTLASC